MALTSSPMQFLEGPPLSLSAYGSGGTSVDAWLQTSLDGGTTWCDMAEFSFTTASARKGASIPSSTAITPVVATDGTLAANSINAGLFGARWRVKYTTVGTYAGGTRLEIDVHTERQAV